MSSRVNTILGASQLVLDAVEGITNAVEHMHANIAATPLHLAPGITPPANSHGLIAAGVYHSIRAVNSTLRAAVTGTSRVLGPELPVTYSHADIRALAALNGVAGDHLEATANPLATRMSLLANDWSLDLQADLLAETLPGASPHIVIFVHGLALSELSWQGRDGSGIGARLARESGLSPLYLRYNSGRHISTNGREFAALLELLCAAWPTRVESLSLVGHSMGGLVIRSACRYGEQRGSPWVQLLQRVVCLGTPHHGAPLEKAGHALDRVLLATPWTAPLAFGRRRSAGIKDLRHGNLLDEDWQGIDQDVHGADNRVPVPLLEHADYFFAAATVGEHLHDPLGQILGDLLVRLGSALGSHPDDLREVGVRPEHCRVFHQKHHFDLLHDTGVHEQLLSWLG